MTMKQWYVVNTRPNQEQRAVENLERQDFEVWLPYIRQTKRQMQRLQKIKKPMFPGYLFVNFDIENQAWGAINSTYGVRNLIGTGAHPLPLDEEFVGCLRASVDTEGICDLIDHTDIKVGDQVRIIDGPFADCVATISHLPAGDRVKVLFQILGGSVAATIPKHALSPVD